MFGSIRVRRWFVNNGKERHSYMTSLLNFQLDEMKWWTASLPSTTEKGNDDAITGKHGSEHASLMNKKEILKISKLNPASKVPLTFKVRTSSCTFQCSKTRMAVFQGPI